MPSDLAAVPLARRDDWPLSWLDRVRESITIPEARYTEARLRRISDRPGVEKRIAVDAKARSESWSILIGTETWSLAATVYGFLAVRRDFGFPPAPTFGLAKYVASLFHRVVVQSAQADVCRISLKALKAQVGKAPRAWVPVTDADFKNDPHLRIPQPNTNQPHERFAFSKKLLAIFLSGAPEPESEIVVRLVGGGPRDSMTPGERVSEWGGLLLLGPGWLVYAPGRSQWTRTGRVPAWARDEFQCESNNLRYPYDGYDQE